MEVYNGKTAKEWYELYCSEILKGQGANNEVHTDSKPSASPSVEDVEVEAQKLDMSIGISVPSRSVELAVGYLVKVVEEDMKLSHGPTALYWHLITVIHKHTRP